MDNVPSTGNIGRSRPRIALGQQPLEFLLADLPAMLLAHGVLIARPAHGYAQSIQGLAESNLVGSMTALAIDHLDLAAIDLDASQCRGTVRPWSDAGLTMLTTGDPKHLSAPIAITSVLHTWGSAMTHHPHVHMIVPGGGPCR